MNSLNLKDENSKTINTREYAFEFARSGRYISVTAVEKALLRQGLLDAPVQLYGRSIRNEVTRVCRVAAGLPPLQMGRRK